MKLLFSHFRCNVQSNLITLSTCLKDDILMQWCKSLIKRTENCITFSLKLTFASTHTYVHCRLENDLTPEKFSRKTEGAILKSATAQFETWSYFHFSLASKREALYLSLEMRYSKNFKNGNFLPYGPKFWSYSTFFQTQPMLRNSTIACTPIKKENFTQSKRVLS